MAIYHLSVKAVRRKIGQSSVAKAAYISNSRLYDQRVGKSYNFTNKNDCSFSTVIGWKRSLSELWNEAEKVEKRKDATVGREYEVALPVELSEKENEKLAEKIGRHLHKKYGVAVQIGIHHSGGKNPHAHILTSTRVVENDGKSLGKKSDRELSPQDRKKKGLCDRKEDLKQVRKEVADLINFALREAKIDTEVSEKSHKDRGLFTLPTEHEGVAAHGIKKKGFQAERIVENEKIKEENKRIIGVYNKTLTHYNNLAILELEAAQKNNETEPEKVEENEKWEIDDSELFVAYSHEQAENYLKAKKSVAAAPGRILIIGDDRDKGFGGDLGSFARAGGMFALGQFVPGFELIALAIDLIKFLFNSIKRILFGEAPTATYQLDQQGFIETINNKIEAPPEIIVNEKIKRKISEEEAQKIIDGYRRALENSDFSDEEIEEKIAQKMDMLADRMLMKDDEKIEEQNQQQPQPVAAAAAKGKGIEL